VTAKRKYHIALLPKVHEYLRKLAFERNESIGDTIAFMVDNAAVFGYSPSMGGTTHAAVDGSDGKVYSELVVPSSGKECR
jgi:hypothetical protein